MKKYKLSKRGELLAIKTKNKIDQLKASVPRPASGIPLNALPGWADVPLYEKLPMLDCPNNQIIFTNSQIGRGLPKIIGEYDTNCHNDINKYDSLNDPHLRNFYSRNKNLELLKKYGIITQDNYVICNLYEFNTYRRLLNRFHLLLIHKELKRKETEQQNRSMIAHAENVAKKEYGKRMLKADYCDPKKVYELKNEKYNKKLEKNRMIVKNIEEKSVKIQKIKNLKLNILKQQAQLHQVAIQQRQIIANDLLRKSIITTKKHLKYMNDLSRKHIKAYKENILKERLEKKAGLWNKRIQNTIKTHAKNLALMAEHEAVKRTNIERHIQNSKQQWHKIQNRIAEKSKTKTLTNYKTFIKEKIAKKLYKDIKNHNNYNCKIKDNISKLTCKDIEDAVHTVIDLQDSISCPHTNESIYGAAKYIIEKILTNIDYDLNENKNYFSVVKQNVDEIFEKTKYNVMQKVKSTLKDLKSIIKSSTVIKNGEAAYARSVSFYEISSIIGISALKEEYDMFCRPVNIKSIKERMPTPAGSLTSITAALEEVTKDPLIGDTTSSQKERNEKIFLSHLLIKFKRQLLIGVSQKVFQILKEYFENQIFQINKKLLEVDRKYLSDEVTKSILKYNINKYDFQANSRFCISALSSHIICELQNYIFDQSNSLNENSIDNINKN